MTVAALVLGAGSGERLRASLPDAGSGAPPKAFVRLRGRTLLARSIEALLASGEVALVQPVLPAAALPAWPAVERELRCREGCLPPVAGGARRQDSVARGLAGLPAEVGLVAVHDAARPLVDPADVAAVVRAARGEGAALLAAPVADTIHRVRGGRVVDTPPRDECWAALTPQVFRIDWLREALARATAEDVECTDDAALVARLGHAVRVVRCGAPNPKITHAADVEAAEAWLAACEPRAAGGEAR
jgi:2-C-methyl-D-erythritol 4-phosphate cytidylyltransferase